MWLQQTVLPMDGEESRARYQIQTSSILVGNMDRPFRPTYLCIEMEPGFSKQQLQALVLAVRSFLPTQSFRDPDK